MSYLSERINTPISTKELERRWAAVRAAMAEQRIDVLLMQNNNDHMGGYVKYFTDLPAMFGYPVTVTFPKDDRMSVISQGAIGAEVQLPPEGDGLRRGVKRSMTTSSFASAPYSLVYDAAARRAGARALCKRDDRPGRTRHAAGFPCRSSQGRQALEGEVRRCIGPGRPDQGHQERGGDFTYSSHGCIAGCGDEGCLRRDQAGHARV